MRSIIVIGINSRYIKPLLGLVDPLHVKHMPKSVATYSGFDVLWYRTITETILQYHFFPYAAMHWNHTLAYLIKRGPHVPLTLSIVLPTKEATQFLTSGLYMP